MQKDDELAMYEAKLKMETTAAIQKAKELNALAGSRTGSGSGTSAPGGLYGMPPEVAEAYSIALDTIETNADYAYMASALGRQLFIQTLVDRGISVEQASSLYPQFINDAELKLKAGVQDQPKYKTVDSNYTKLGENVMAQISALTPTSGIVSKTLGVFSPKTSNADQVAKIKDYIYNNIELVYGPEMAQQFYSKLPQ
jgi:hypothetical protein